MNETKHTPGPWRLVGEIGDDFGPAFDTAIAAIAKAKGESEVEHE